jgi:hypothetical protein
MKFSDKFIGYLDILGFKNFVDEAEAGTGMSLNELQHILNSFGTSEERKNFEKYGPTTCPESNHLKRNLDFRLTQMSDGMIVSSEISPAGVINLISHCWIVLMKLLQSGVMCRGYITRGSIYHTDTKCIGSGFHKAYENEKNVTAFARDADERGTPFVEVDSVVCKFIKDSNDECVKKMFSRFVKGDGEAVALYPFQRLSHSFTISAFGEEFNPAKEKSSNQNLRIILEGFKEKITALVDKSNTKAIKKAEHYIQALDAQLTECDRTDEAIDMLSSPYPKDRL